MIRTLIVHVVQQHTHFRQSFSQYDKVRVDVNHATRLMRGVAKSECGWEIQVI